MAMNWTKVLGELGLEGSWLPRVRGPLHRDDSPEEEGKKSNVACVDRLAAKGKLTANLQDAIVNAN